LVGSGAEFKMATIRENSFAKIRKFIAMAMPKNGARGVRFMTGNIKKVIRRENPAG